MKAIVMYEFGGRDQLTLGDVPAPEPGPTEVLIRIRAAGVNPVDWKIREGKLVGRLPHHFPLIPGWDAAGTVEKVGHDAHDFSPGDEVFAYCRKPVVQEGTYAEYISVPYHFVSPKPARLSLEEAAAVPLAGLTAYQSLIEAVQLTASDTVLVHAAAGGVGHYAVQLAVSHGATVVATAQHPNHEFVRSLGAGEIIDYSTDDFRDIVRDRFPEGIDAAFDTVGGNVTFQSMEILKPGGRLVSILRPPDDEIRKQAESRNIRYHYVFVRPESTHLSDLATQIDKGIITPYLSLVVPIEEAARAHAMIETGHTRGKIVLSVR